MCDVFWQIGSMQFKSNRL